MEFQAFRHLPSDRERWIQRYHRLLENHAYSRSAHVTHLSWVQLGQILAVQIDASAGPDNAGGQQIENVLYPDA